MAEHAKTEYLTAEGNDYQEHEKTYGLFVTLVKWGVIINVVILALMAYFLV